MMALRNILPFLLLASLVASQEGSISASTAPRTCLAKTVSLQQGPVYVAFQLPPSEAGRQIDFEGGRAYRDSGGTCFSVGWSNHTFVCDGETQDYIQRNGNWTVSAEIPQDCVNGGGSMENHNQEYLLVSNSYPMTCPGKSIDVYSNPIHVRFTLPEGRDTSSSVFYNFGSAGRKIDGQCFQIEWTNLVFTCDAADFEWKQTSGQWRAPENPLGCDSWQEGGTQLSNVEQQFLQVVDITGQPPCGAIEEKRTSGPLSVAFQLPGDINRGTIIAYESGQAVRWFNSTCHNLMWTDHTYGCDAIAGKWVLESGDFVPAPTDPRFCNGLNGGFILNGDQPYLEVIDFSQTGSPTSAPYAIVRPIITESPSWSPTDAPINFQRPIETDIPQAPTVASVPGWPTSAPVSVVTPLEPSGSTPTTSTTSSGGATYATDPPPTMRPTNTPTIIAATPVPSPRPTPAPTNQPTPGPTPTSTITATTPVSTILPTPLPTISNATPRPTSITVQPTIGVVVSRATVEPTSSPVSGEPTFIPPVEPPTSVPATNDAAVTFCGCSSCTAAIWNSDADSFTCGERILYIVNSVGSLMADACRQVAGQEFPSSCGPFCDPDSCQSIDLITGTAVNNVDTVQPTTVAPTQNTTVAPIQTPAAATMSPSPLETSSFPVQTDTGGAPLVNAKPGISAGLAELATPAATNSVTIVPTEVPTSTTQAPSPSGTLILSTDQEGTPNLRAVSGASSISPSFVACETILLLLFPVYSLLVLY